MDNIIKLDLISLKESAGGGNQFDSENNNIFFALGKYDYLKIKGYKYKKISAILELKHNDMEENDLVNYNVMSYYLVNPLFDNCCLRDLMDEPYCIVSFLRGNLFETTINKIIDSKILDISDDIKFQIYNQLNGLDYVLILGSNKLTSLMKFITSIRDLIYCKKNDNDKTETVILDSFSIIGMKKDKICNNTEIIPRISIHAKMKDMKKKNSMIKDLSIIENNNNLKIQKYYNIGHSDFIFTFFNVEINKFITVYDDFFKKNMNLNNNYFTFLDTKFSIEVNNQNKQNHVEISEDEFDVIHQQETKNKYLEKISDLNEELYHCKELITSYGDIYYYNILNILEIISNIEKNKQYCISYEVILDSLILFIGKIKEFQTIEKKEMITEEDFCLVCNSINRILETIDHLQKQTGIANYINNESIYNFPYKFLDFYNKFLKEIINCFSDAYRYNFLITPSLVQGIQIVQLFSDNNPNDKLLIINIPVNLFYNPEVLCPMLVHDIGHYHGQEIRNRDERKGCFLSSISNILVLRIFNHTRLLGDDCMKEVKDEFIENINSKYSKKNAVNFYMNHKDYLQPFFIDEIKNFLIENQGNILNKVSSKLIEKGENIKTIKEEMGIILDNISNMLYFESEEVQNIEQIHSIKTDVKDLMDLYYEGFADAFAMKVLGIDINDFIKCFNVNGSGSLRKTKIDSDYDLGEIRILIQQYDKNSNNEPDKTTKENDSDENFYLDKIRYDFIRIGDILAPCQEYINDCKNAIQKEIDDDKNKIGIQNIQDIYKAIKDDAININEKIKKIDDFLNL